MDKTDAPVIINNSESILDDNDFIVSKTDNRGFITYCNRIFVKMSGYSIDELIGSNHNLIRHPDIPAICFEVMWKYIKDKKEFFGYVKNLRKDGGFYWVFAYITADLDTYGNIIGYTSFRRKPNPKALEIIEPIYRDLITIEKSGNNSYNRLLEILNGTRYDDFVLSLQES